MSKSSKSDNKKNAENTQPGMGSANVPIWLFVVLGVLMYWGTMYLDQHGGGFSAQVYEPYPSKKFIESIQPKTGGDELIARGEEVYALVCSPCHQPNGMGSPGQFPPLAGSEWVTDSGPQRLIRITLQGLTGPIEVKGEQWNLAMPAMGASLSDAELAAVLSYVRNSWGNNVSVVTPETVTEVKEATSGRAAPWSAAELQDIPVE